jgi:ferrous iron transport protein A
MVLSELHKGDKAEIININADKALKDRLISFGVMRGETLVIKGCSLARQTMEIEVGSTHIALRAEEASKIEVRQINN